jgi:murein DD-endopeptidase MepM/ murein hydrolase activator NlpD
MQRIGFKFATYIVIEGMIRFFKNYIRLVSSTITCLYICVSADAQAIKYPQHYFRNPLDIPMELAANFGELRSNHWHMGLDIRTNQKENLPVYAAAEGYIAYVGVRPQSFGRFIIINHPNGYSTLYAHLNDFYPALHQYVLDEQYKNESWLVELDLPKDKFKVSKGQFIAYSGNTGGSQGPHVHFEIRETKTDRSLNPLLFGMPIKDDVPPTISRLAMYDRSTSTYVQTPQLFSLKKTDSGYIIPKIPVHKNRVE